MRYWSAEKLLLAWTLVLSTASLRAGTLSIAHRGNSTAGPENTLAAFSLARGVADIVEFDVQPTADHQWVVMHDDTVDRTTTGTGLVSSLTLAQLESLDAGSWYSPNFAGQRIPTLESAIATIRDGGMIPMLERKNGSADELVHALQSLGATSQVILHSFDWAFLGQVHSLDPTIRLAALADGSVTPEKLDQIQSQGVQTVNWTKTNTTAATLSLVHSRGMQMFTYTVDDRPTIEAMVRLGVDGILTDYPVWVTELTRKASIRGRHIFYDNSRFDGYRAGAGADDDAALAPDKEPLLPGGTASFANYTSFSKGINGIAIDVHRLGGALTADDFEFRVGNSADLQSWSMLEQQPSVIVRPSAGQDGSDRVELIWPSGSVMNEWLEITVKADANTGLAQADVFYFGNAVGESGNSAGNAFVSTADEIEARNDGHTFLNPAPLINVHDYNRDSLVNAADQIISRNHGTSFLNSLSLIHVPALLAATPVPEPAAASLFLLGFFFLGALLGPSVFPSILPRR